VTFSGAAKAELCQIPFERPCCAQAESYGVLLYCNKFDAGEIRIVTESDAFARRLPALFERAFALTFDRTPDAAGDREGKRTFCLYSREKIHAVSAVSGYDPSESVAHHINFGALEDECCRTAFFRGAFLAGGSVTDPAKRYHLELATSHYHVSRELTVLLREAGFSPKETTRKANYMTYFKQGDAIEQFLWAVGAPEAAARMREARTQKGLIGSVNRRVNCDAANLDKMVEAAQEQLEAIRRLRRQPARWEQLPDKLRRTALLRMEHPELSLAQLSELCEPPVTKSCLNHRLRKLLELSRT